MQDNRTPELILRRDEQGLAELLLHYGPLMRYIIAPILTNPQDQVECLSEAAMKIWDKIDTFDRSRGSWTAWLTALTRNTALNRARQIRPTEELREDMADLTPSPEEVLLRRERKEAVLQTLDGLSAKDRTLFYRKYYYLQSTAQIVAETGLTERAVEARLYRIRKQLRNTLGGEGYD